MTDQEAFEELMAMSETELENVSYEVNKWHCCIEGCDRFTRIKDFGASPWYRWRKKWINITIHMFFYCGKHWQYFKRVPSKLKYKKTLGTENVSDE